MNIYAKIIKDSIYRESRLTTFEVCFPKVLLAEFNTHRVFSRNFSSSRAIPVSKMTDDNQDFFEPSFWGKNKAGMQSDDEEITDIDTAKKMWYDAVQYSRTISNELMKLGVHKQWANRLNDWHVMAKGIVSSTDYDNFFSLRCHESAQPEIRILAECMRNEYLNNTPCEMKANQYHLPYINNDEYEKYDIKNLVKFSVARCARVSYKLHDNSDPNPEKDFELYNRLVGSKPIHASPAEHQAKATLLWPPYTDHTQSGNFNNNWKQYRKFIETNTEEEFFNDCKD